MTRIHRGAQAWASALALAAPALAAEPPRAAAPVEYLYSADADFSLVAAPGRVSAIVLEPGETLAAANPIAAGDTARWIIGETASGQGGTRRVHVLVKPVAPGLSTNLLILTDRRTYRLELRASARAYVPLVRWRYGAAAAALTGEAAR